MRDEGQLTVSDSPWLAYERLNCTDCMARLRETELHRLDGSLNRDSPWLAYERLNCEFGVFDERAWVVSRRGGNDVFRRLTQGRRTID